MRFPAILFVAILFGVHIGQAQDVTNHESQIVDKIILRERALTTDLQSYHPFVETYAQIFSQKDGQLVPKRDRHFLSVAQFSGELRALRFKPHNASFLRDLDESLDGIVPNSIEFDPSGFVAMAYPPPDTFDRSHYNFRYLNQEFLGEVRCLVFEVHPITTRYSAMFEGRIWVEDKDLTIVRYNGIYKTENLLNGYFHFD